MANRGAAIHSLQWLLKVDVVVGATRASEWTAAVAALLCPHSTGMAAKLMQTQHLIIGNIHYNYAGTEMTASEFPRFRGCLQLHMLGLFQSSVLLCLYNQFLHWYGLDVDGGYTTARWV